jgi:hypothetical protein
MSYSVSHVTLPGGYWVAEGKLYRDAWVRPLSGEVELWAAESQVGAVPARRVTELLASCVGRIGDLVEPGMTVAAGLTVGDREALLLHLRRLTYGERMQCVLTCPWPRCGERMDLDLGIHELLVPKYENICPEHETEFGVESGRCRVKFRLPTGADQEAAAGLAARAPHDAAQLILDRCVSSVMVNETLVDRLPLEAAEPLARVMSDLDPQAEMRLDPVCPACGRGFSTILDTAAYFFHEIAARGRAIVREVDLLAARYHWSEAAILGMTSPRRRSYCALQYERAQSELVR